MGCQDYSCGGCNSGGSPAGYNCNTESSMNDAYSTGEDDEERRRRRGYGSN